MSGGLLEQALSWCRQLPEPFLRQLADAARGGPAECSALANNCSGQPTRSAAKQAREYVNEGHGGYLAGVIDSSLALRRDREIVQPVWTGPTSAAGGRLTAAVINDLIAEATGELVLVSYAAYPPLTLTDALKEAIARGVDVTLLLERPEDHPGWNGPANAFAEVVTTRLTWPAAARPHGASMHAKLLVVDRRVALVGSANLTAAAFGKNLECGLVVRGGAVPGLIVDHIRTAKGLVKQPV